MESQLINFLNQIKEKTNKLISKIDTQEKEIKTLTEENKKLNEKLSEYKARIIKINQEKSELEYDLLVNKKNKEQKQEIIKKIDNTIRVIDKTVTLLNK